MIAFRNSTILAAERHAMLKLPPETSIGQAELDASVAERPEILRVGNLRSVDSEQIDADLVGFWRHVIDTRRP